MSENVKHFRSKKEGENMQKEMIFYYISIIMISIAMKELYRGMRKDFLCPKKLMKTLIYKSTVRLVYIYIY